MTSDKDAQENDRTAVEEAAERERQLDAVEDADELEGDDETSLGDGDAERTLSAYLRRWWTQIRAGQSGVLPVVLGVILIGIIFQTQNAKFLSPGNLVNLLVQGAVYMLIGMGEVFVLLLGEIDLSLGYVAGIGAVVVTELVQPGTNWPWYLAILAALVVTGVIGALQGTLVTRVRLPSFVVTLAGLLGWQGVMIKLLGTGGTIPIQNKIVNAIANGTISRLGGWILIAVVVALYAFLTLRQDGLRRKSGLAAPGRILTYLKILVVAVA
ncbi:MAG: hypothetical protein P8Y02_03915, partial [Deinococcales bacterium]